LPPARAEAGAPLSAELEQQLRALQAELDHARQAKPE
jgi:hypothetical protein